MALEIKSIPVLTGNTAEIFVSSAEHNERNPRRQKIRFSPQEIQKIANSGKQHSIAH